MRIPRRDWDRTRLLPQQRPGRSRLPVARSALARSFLFRRHARPALEHKQRKRRQVRDWCVCVLSAAGHRRRRPGYAKALGRIPYGHHHRVAIAVRNLRAHTAPDDLWRPGHAGQSRDRRLFSRPTNERAATDKSEELGGIIQASRAKRIKDTALPASSISILILRSTLLFLA